MDLFRLGAFGAEIPAARLDDVSPLFDLRPICDDIGPEFFRAGADRAEDSIRSGRLPLLEGAERMRRGAPLAPGAVVCVGMNYAGHAAESGTAPPAEPVIFLKHPNTISGPDDTVALPSGSLAMDWEVELGIVIGERARYLSSPAESAAHIVGYVVSNDLSERDWQLSRSGGQWSKGKNFETFNPLGPYIRTADAVEPGNLRLRSWVNGEPRQDSSTADLIFDVHRIVYELSQFMVLEPGDLVNTGTPEGVGLSGRFPYLRAGDLVECEIDGLGRQCQRVVDATEHDRAYEHD